MVDQPRNGRRAAALKLLQSFELWCDEKRVQLPPAAQRLVAFLALQPRPLNRVYVAGTLWIDYSQHAANANLRTALWRLRQAPYPLIESTSTQLSLASGVAVDVHETAAVAQRISANESGCDDEELEDIVAAGEVLPDWYDDWIVIERERFRQARLHALEDLCYALTRRGRYSKALEVGLTAVAGEPLRETAHRAVMRVHLAEGNRSEAIRQYELCRRLLQPLDLEPSAETQGLRRRCATGDGLVTAVR